MALGRLQNEQDLENWLKRHMPNLLGPDRIANLAGIDFGTATLSFTASASSATLTQAHDLGVTPSAVVATLASAANTGYCIVSALDSDSFDIRAVINAAITGTRDAYWVAVV